jgi:two-component system chemotaxis sensor kinase CheA
MGIGLRMVPLVGVFQKMRRLVRDLCVKVGKEAVLVTHGDGIEMDRSLVEQVADPLVHILRNAMDHGLETPQDRLAAGKPAQGTIILSASHEAGNIVIEVRDDGRGMDRAKIVARAVERGLIAPDAELADAEVFELIFAPGFSTAERVTEVSGRGVGMDVVKRNVEAMGGRVRVASVPGAGSTVRLTVPLTLAIIDGMLIGCADERFVVPTRSIVESIRAESRMLVTYAGRHEVVDIRGELYPLVRLHQVLDIPTRSARIEDGLLLVVEGITRRFAILVDEVVSRQQVVIKAMDDRLVDTRFYSGACILADGHAGLILNIDALLAQSDGREATGGAA